MARLVDFVKPNPGYVTPSVFWVIGGLWIVLALIFWASGQATVLPSPMETIHAFPKLWEEGLGQELWTSFSLNLEAVAIMAVVSYLLAVATVMPLFRPLATLVSSGRFNGFVGLPLVFTILLHDPHKVKIALLVFGMGVFTVLSLVKMIESIPKERFDHSRTLRMGPWRVVWEVVVLGQFDQVLDILRINIAMGWMMLPMVEGRFKFEGGVGALMENESKHFNMDMVFCTLFVILAVGLVQDFVIGYFKTLVCPHACLGMER